MFFNNKKKYIVNYTNFYAYRRLLQMPLLKSSLHIIKSNMLCRKSKIDNLTNSGITIKYKNASMQLNATPPLSDSYSQRTAQLFDVALINLARSLSAPTPEGLLARVSGSYPFNDCMDQYLLSALGAGGCVCSYWIFCIVV